MFVKVMPVEYRRALFEAMQGACRGVVHTCRRRPVAARDGKHMQLDKAVAAE
jgi:hypothetical protein